MAESSAINPKQCKNLKFFECRKMKLGQKVEIKNDWQVQKEVTNQAFWLVNGQRNAQMANQIFCFQIKRTPWMAQFFPDRVIRVRFFCLTISKFFLCILLISIKPWSNVHASSRKLITWGYLRLRLARPCVHLRWLAMTCDHFGRDQICPQVNASFLPFGHPTQVNASSVTEPVALK